MNKKYISKTAILLIIFFSITVGFMYASSTSRANEAHKKIQEVKIFYNKAYFPDQQTYYDPQVSEIIKYTNGETKLTPDLFLHVRCKKNEMKQTYHLMVISSKNHYEIDVPVVTVTSITSKTKVSTKKALSAKNIKLTLHYSDGSERKIASAAVTSKTIKKPKEGINILTCSYKDQDYPVKVKAYDPDPKVSFKGYGSFTLSPKKEYTVPGANRLTQSMGVTHFNNHTETYYSQRVLPGTALNIPGRHVADDGTVRDKDGYICVASDYAFYDKHEVLLTSLGPAKVYDTGCAYGTIDLYVNW